MAKKNGASCKRAIASGKALARKMGRASETFEKCKIRTGSDGDGACSKEYDATYHAPSKMYPVLSKLASECGSAARDVVENLWKYEEAKVSTIYYPCGSGHTELCKLHSKIYGEK